MTSFINSDCIFEDLKTLFDEYDSQLVRIDNLCEIVDDDKSPYHSKYIAREMLDKLYKKLETYNIVLKLESQRNNDMISELTRRTMNIVIRLASIGYECEEPHEAEKELNRIGENYYPDFLKSVESLCDDGLDENEGEVNVDELRPPTLVLNGDYDLQIVLKSLNLFGILWSGRNQIKKAFMFLFAGKNLYFEMRQDVDNHPSKQQLDSLLTHNMFYIAQAYGHIKILKLSCVYCHETLSRQLLDGFDSIQQTLDWCKNCVKISDFYISMEYFRRSYLSLQAASIILNVYILKYLNVNIDDNTLQLNVRVNYDKSVQYSQQLYYDSIELSADIHRRFGNLYESILKKAFERENILFSSENVEEVLAHFRKVEILEENFCKEFDVICLPNWKNSSCEPSNKSQDSYDIFKSFFVGFDFGSIPSKLCVSEILTFDHAKVVFLKGLNHIESAKKYFILDGYVTDHSSLIQSQSKLYHYISIFEGDAKRILAMESRRVELLLPLLLCINKTAFENIHKQISYELGETYLTLLETKLSKFKTRDQSTSRQDETVDISTLKRVEIIKCNSYCRGALIMFAHFTRLYSKNIELPTLFLPFKNEKYAADEISKFSKLSFPQIWGSFCRDTNVSLVTEEEFRPLLNCHFLCGRILSKIIISPLDPNTAGIEPTVPLQHCVDVYYWLIKFAKEVASEKQMDISGIFSEELRICQDMCDLLPSKIYRMKLTGERGLNL